MSRAIVRPVVYGKRILVLLAIMFFAMYTKATHIIGGEIHYECLGNGNYVISLKVYRDCYNGVPFFDDTAAIGVFDSSNRLVKTLGLPLPDPASEILDPMLYRPCMLPPGDVCVERTTYQDTFYLPPKAGGYTLAYQRCCRNHTINNIVQPDNTGSTYTTSINDPSLVSCNSSPYFTHYPPVFICVDEALDFDHSATDPDGDSLYYSLCTPFTGGGIQGVWPNPPSAPPYSHIRWKTPYSQSDQFGGVPLAIDFKTGKLTGTPNKVGQFVVGVCVEEYRDGKYLGSHNQDFQFNVLQCIPYTKAEIEPEIVQCGDSIVQFENNSIGAITYSWDFGVDQMKADTSVKKEPIFRYPEIGIYDVSLIVNKGMKCADTANCKVKIFSLPNADFEYSNQCGSQKTVFEDRSTVRSTEIESWDWSFGDGTSSEQQHPHHLYQSDGHYDVTLTVVTQEQCTHSTTKWVQMFPEPDATFSVVSAKGCEPFTTTFRPRDVSDTYGTYVWKFSDGTVKTGMSPTHTFKEPGSYSVTLEMVSSQGCADTASTKDLITVLPRPQADFYATPPTTDIWEPEFEFVDESVDAIDWEWTFDDSVKVEGYSFITHRFEEAGWHNVSLAVEGGNGCRDTANQQVFVEPVYRLYIPNSFSPNNDGVNDHFTAKGVGIKDFRIWIYDRWGKVLFSTTDRRTGWTGEEDGKKVMQGVYNYVVQVTDAFDEVHKHTGTVTLIR